MASPSTPASTPIPSSIPTPIPTSGSQGDTSTATSVSASIAASTTSRTVDAVVIGLGPGGEDIAARLARGGWSVLAVDEHLVGGECPYYGCIPSKMMLHESRRADASWARVARRIREEATDQWDDRVAVERLLGTGAEFVHGRAEIVGGPAAGPASDGTEVTVTPNDGGAHQTWTARRAVVLNTGSESVRIPVPGLPEAVTWTHRDVVTAETLPASLAIVGGGPVGCELAQALAGFGVRVSLMVRGERLLSGEVPEAGELVAERFRAEGIDVRTRTEIRDVQAGEASRYETSHGIPASAGPVDLELTTGDRLTVDRVLLATGRAPRDPVDVDDWCRVLDGARTEGGQPVPGRYAIGDMTGAGPFTHTSMAQAAVVADQLLAVADPRPFPRHAVPRVTYTDPEVAAVGLSEGEARKAVEQQGGDASEVHVVRVDLGASSRGWIDEVRGHLTLVAQAEETEASKGAGGTSGGVLVGAAVVGPHAGEILGALTVAVHARVPLAELARIPWAYPTLHRSIGDAVSQFGSEVVGAASGADPAS
ncbi:NAD(P)/FAD-dependent oxidoreductase [Citricoccus sp.]|uniref:dihydrolipoyl dehydrogenase family protein n=1 Tax=Citricoccus sp. TaxID=1978372 RepID=UPI0028BD2769|nr:NAD(P)/FAD-dependent oxidoreductase [Citricoccus sp.]